MTTLTDSIAELPSLQPGTRPGNTFAISVSSLTSLLALCLSLPTHSYLACTPSGRTIPLRLYRKPIPNTVPNLSTQQHASRSTSGCWRSRCRCRARATTASLVLALPCAPPTAPTAKHPVSIPSGRWLPITCAAAAATVRPGTTVPATATSIRTATTTAAGRLLATSACRAAFVRAAAGSLQSRALQSCAIQPCTIQLEPWISSARPRRLCSSSHALQYSRESGLNRMLT
jgi:hypothetical protein